MKKNILLSVLFLIFINPNFATAQVITAAELFETIKSGPHPRDYEKASPLNELAFFIKEFTKESKGIVTPTALYTLKAFLEHEGKNCNNPFNTYYEDLLIYLEQKYPSDPAIFRDQNCSICLSQPTNPVVLSCNHIFCYDCLFEWYTKRNLKKDDNHKQCPCCRKNLDSSVFALFIIDPQYKEKSEAAMREYEQEEFRERLLRIIFLGSQIR